ncbi:MAG: cytidine deaminase [Defluviitaleaceae bacterium]|nr:cytidine deaminase [Defluviitaleaceae bacterium]
MDKSIIENLIEVAISTRKNAYAPYSGFKVGAGLLTLDGKVIGGCNIENAAYSPAICAERTAISTAVAAGHTKFTAIAVVGGENELIENCFPCGVCRQVLAEFCAPDFTVIIAKNTTEYQIFTLAELLPHIFSL